MYLRLIVILSAGTLVSDVIVLETPRALALGWIPQIILAPATGERIFDCKLADCWLLSPEPPLRFSSVEARGVAGRCRVACGCRCRDGFGCRLRRGGTIDHSFPLSLFLLSMVLPMVVACFSAAWSAAFSSFSAAMSHWLLAILASNSVFSDDSSCWSW